MNIDGNIIANWLINNVVFIMVVIVAITIITAAITKKPRDAFIAFGLCMLGLGLVALAASWQAIGQWISATFFGG